MKKFLALGMRIAEIRDKSALSQQEFGDRIGVAQTQVSAYERGDDRPRRATVLNICREFCVDENALTTGRGPLYIDATSKSALPAMAWNEPPEMYTKDPRRQELLRKVKQLIADADEQVIDALIKNVDVFIRVPPEKKKEE